MVKKEEVHPLQAVKPDFPSVHFVRGRTSSCNPSSAAGWAHMQCRNPHSPFRHKWEVPLVHMRMWLAVGHIRLLARCLQDIYLTWSALLCQDVQAEKIRFDWPWNPNLAVSCENWFRSFLRAIFLVYLLNTLLWHWCVNSWETGITFLIDLLDSCTVWQCHDHKSCSVSVPLDLCELQFCPPSLYSPLCSTFSQLMKFLRSLYCKLIRWIWWCDCLW